MSCFYRIMRALFILPIMLLFRIKKYGIHNLPKDGPLLLCCNHTSISDIFFIGIICPRQVCFMGKDELFKNRILSFLFRKLGAFPVNRRTGDTGAIKHAEELLENGKILGIFPEGTRHPGEAPHKAKPGAAMIALATKAPILPCAIYRNTGKVKLFQKVTFRFGKPISYEEYSGGLEGRAAIRQATDAITASITELWELKHDD